MKEYQCKKRAFKISTRSNTLGTDLYVVIANTYAEAEDIYWNELNGYQEILSIDVIPNTTDIGFRVVK